MLNELGIDKGRVAKFVLLPEILPRIFAFFRSGLGSLAYMVAVVFNTVRIIPDNHPYLSAANHGRFSVFQAFAAAADNIAFNKKNIDKISIFVVILTGMAVLLMQFVLLILATFTAKSFAADGPSEYSHFFSNENYETDLVFRIMDIIFGVPGIFDSQEIGNAGPFHDALHALFEFYSFGIMLVGVFVILYLTVAIVLETAQSGVPFGKRFEKAWAPVRLILFFGLLLPIMPTSDDDKTYGLNFAQYLVLTAAKLGSNVATNAWLAFDDAIETTYLGKEEELIAQPNPPNLDSFVTYMQLAKVCSWAEGRINGRDVQPYAVFGDGAANAVPIGNKVPSFSDFAEKAKGGTIFIRFGEQDDDLYKDEDGAVFPYCGILTLTIVDRSQPGSAVMQQAYLELIGCMWSGSKWGKGLSDPGDMKDSALGSNPNCKSSLSNSRGEAYSKQYSVVAPRDPYPDAMNHMEASWAKLGELRMVSLDLDKAIETARDKQIKEGDWLNKDVEKYGWGGVGIWYNKIAEQNGALTAAVFAKPEIRKMPYVMEFIQKEKMKQDPATPLSKMFTPILSSGKSIQFEEPQQREVAIVLNQLMQFWGTQQTVNFIKDLPESHEAALNGNILIDTINLFLGTKGLFDMCKNTDIHPLAQLSSMGKGMVEHAIRGFGTALGVGAISGVMGLVQGMHNFSQALGAVTSFLMTFASIGLILGFVLFYVVPMLPFIYFFFAVMTWVKGVFEAMVGVPLWALAHLHIDGEGMPGDSASQGYYYILEIFLRPIFIVLGFMGGITIFTAMVKVLNQIFYLVVSNLTGHELTGITGCFAPPADPAGGTAPDPENTEEMFKGGVVDEFFYTVVYAIIVYLIALPTFKMVDLVPDHLMRWFGVGITPFGAQDGDAVGDIMTHVSAGAGLVGQKLQGGIGGALQAFK